MFYVTGDLHRDFGRFYGFCDKYRTTKEDVMIVLGDAGLNYYGDERDECLKEDVQALPLTFFCIHGNHEMRPWHVKGCEEVAFHGGTVWQEDAYPDILYAKDGEIYSFDGLSCVVLGGAYSVDKELRILRGWHWFEDEQPSAEIRAYAEQRLAACGNKVDVVLSHTCPEDHMPIEAFLSGLDQSKVDRSTEQWLDRIEKSLDHQKWYCGHFHIQKEEGKFRFLFENILPLQA